MTSRPSYQLTDHAVGSLREVWQVSWPLMLGLCSASFMMFADRLYLSHYSVAAMNAMAVGGLTCFLLLVMPFCIGQITEVFVGRFHGEGRYDMLGKPVWQVIWISFISYPIMLFMSYLISQALYGVDSGEAIYIVNMMYFSPFFLASVALMGFFIGIGKTHVITWATVCANLVNIGLAPLFIFGIGLPKLGIQGAALATGIAQVFQVAFLLTLFLQNTYRAKFCTDKASFDSTLCRSMLQLSLPSGFGRLIEVVTHLAFFRIIAMAGDIELAKCTMVQSFYLLTIFCIDGLSKGVTTIVSNLVGAKEDRLIPNAIFSGMKLHTIIFAAIFCLSVFGCEWIFKATLQDNELALINNENFLFSLRITLIWMSLFFLVDGFSWIQSGYLLARNDSKYIMWISSTVHWITYVLPVYILVKYCGMGAAGGWAALTFDGLVLFMIFWRRTLTLQGLSWSLPSVRSNF